MSNPNASYPRTPWWEHTTTSTEPEPTTTTTTEATTTTAPPPTTTTPTSTTNTTAPEPTNPVEVGKPEPVTVAVSTPLPQVDAVVLAPPVSYHGTAVGLQTLPHTGANTAELGVISAALIGAALCFTALAQRTAR